VDSIFSLRDDEAGGAYKSTRDADADDNDDESITTTEVPKGDEGGAYDKAKRPRRTPPALTPRPEARCPTLHYKKASGGRWQRLQTNARRQYRETTTTTTKRKAAARQRERETTTQGRVRPVARGDSAHPQPVRPRPETRGPRPDARRPRPETREPMPDARSPIPDARFPTNTGHGPVQFPPGESTFPPPRPGWKCRHHVTRGGEMYFYTQTHTSYLRSVDYQQQAPLPYEKQNQPSQYRPDLILSFKLTPLRRQPRGPANLTDPTSAAPAELLLYFQRFEPFTIVCLAPPGANGRPCRRSSKQLLPC
jgi:hypothetical protein